MTGCVEPERAWELLVQADHDGELDAAEAAAVVRHVEICPHCAGLQRQFSALSNRLRAEVPMHGASEVLRRRMTARFAAPRRRMGAIAGFGAGAAIAAGLLLTLLPAGADPAEGLVAAHVRALQPGHLIDVPSSDKHTVKPWFDGRLDFAPPVPDLVAAGFTLVGGRLDVIGARPVAVLVYRRGGHDIDVFVWPGEASAPGGTLRGYNLLAWNDHGMAVRAVSDIEPAALRGFMLAWQAVPEDAGQR